MFDLKTCELAPVLKDETFENKKKYCIETLDFMECLNKTLKKLSCKNFNLFKGRPRKEISFREKIQRQSNFYSEIFNIYCESKQTNATRIYEFFFVGKQV